MKVFIIHQCYESMIWGVFSTREKAEKAMVSRGGGEEPWPSAEDLYVVTYTVDCDEV